MVSLADVMAIAPTLATAEFRVQATLNLYDAPTCIGLATQAATGRQLRILSSQPDPAGALSVVLCEDDYPGWLAIGDLAALKPAPEPYRAIALSYSKICRRLPEVIAFAQAAMAQPNHYLWGGTVGPNYDCSGLMQTAFAASGIWLPRDAYQQEAFLQPVTQADLQPGDLVFFGTPERCTHVGLWVGDRHYLHSSGKDQGRNGIGLDVLAAEGDRISQSYFQQFRGAGRVRQCYMPKAGARGV